MRRRLIQSLQSMGWAIEITSFESLNSATAHVLTEINALFYEERASAFSDTRRLPWPGWARVLREWEARFLGDAREGPPAVLDVGCGNGRFADYLEERYGTDFAYVGLDSSAALLALARDRLGRERGDRRLVQADLMRSPLPRAVAERRFDLVVVFGLLHHLPGLSARRRLLEELSTSLAPRGLLALTFWRFGAFERFRRRVVPWEEFNRGAATPVDPAQLEPGDFLLAWGDAGDSFRYCHFADDSESAGLVESLGCGSVETFLSDGESGELNRYHLVGR